MINGDFTIGGLLKLGAERLKQGALGINVFSESVLLLSFALGKDKAYIVVRCEEPVDKEKAEVYLSYIGRRAANEPVGYITGVKEFMSLEFSVEDGVLIPRPDTETLVEYVIDVCKNKGAAILDLCTGSGAIAVSLAKYLKDAYITAVDISKICIVAARKNAKRHGVEDRVKLIEADIFNDFSICASFDCIVSNPPYIPTSVLGTLMDDVIKYEPSLALDGGSDGLMFYRRIAEISVSLLKVNGYLALEVGHDQAESVKSILFDYGYCDICSLKDLGGISRVVCAKRA